jgi:hypothetical protein
MFKGISEFKTVYMLFIVSFLTILGYGAQRVLVPIYLEETGMSFLALGFFLPFLV